MPGPSDAAGTVSAANAAQVEELVAAPGSGGVSSDVVEAESGALAEGNVCTSPDWGSSAPASPRPSPTTPTPSEPPSEIDFPNTLSEQVVETVFQPPLLFASQSRIDFPNALSEQASEVVVEARVTFASQSRIDCPYTLSEQAVKTVAQVQRSSCTDQWACARGQDGWGSWHAWSAVHGGGDWEVTGDDVSNAFSEQAADCGVQAHGCESRRPKQWGWTRGSQEWNGWHQWNEAEGAGYTETALDHKPGSESRCEGVGQSEVRGEGWTKAWTRRDVCKRPVPCTLR